MQFTDTHDLVWQLSENKCQAKIQQAYAAVSITVRWPRFSVHADCTLQSARAAASLSCNLLLSTVAVMIM